MLIEEALYYQLANDATITALVSTRIYPVLIPEDIDLPAVAYQTIDRTRETAHDGEAGISSARVQITCQAATYTAAKNIAEVIKDSLIAYDGTMGGAGGVTVDGIFLDGELDGFGMSSNTYTVRTSFYVRYRE